MKLKYFYIIIFLILIFGVTHFVRAEEGGIVISPLIVDEKVKIRDIIERQIEIKNNTENKVSIYAVVYDFNDKNGNIKYDGPGSADKRKSISSWVTLKRGEIELMPGEKTEVPLTINVNPNALPGKYYAVIYYVTASNGYEAETNSQSGGWPKTNVNLEVLENKIEKAQIDKFTTNNFYLDGPVTFNLTIQNNGNSELVPAGSIRIFDRRGTEMDELTVNSDNKIVKPSEISRFDIMWPAKGQMGKFKALADITYGTDNDKNFQDTIFFWIIPKKFLIIFSAGVMVLVILLVLIITRRNRLTVETQKGSYQSDKIINLKS